MYTAFLALPPLDSSAGKAKPEEISKTIPPTAVPEISSIASNTVNSAAAKLNSTLLNNVTARYVVAPAMFGGLGSVALRIIQEGGTFMTAANAQVTEPQDGEEIAVQAELGNEDQGSEETLDQPVSEHQKQTEAVVHDFVPSIQLGAGLEFLILVVSSILLGAVVGFIGTILSLDGPPEKANNKSKLAATSLMFALFFPSVITVFQENATSQAKLLRADEEKTVLQDKVRETTQQAENIETVARDRINSDIDQTLETAPESIEPSSPDSLIPFSHTREADPANAQSSLIDSTRVLVVNATSEENAKESINSIFRIGNVDDGAVRDHAIRALREIEKNSALSEAVQQAAAEKAEDLLNTVTDSPE
ncbi:MAG: hypothetical protein ACFB14_07985 [Leptolyngbyaceae cyanobacterium]